MIKRLFKVHYKWIILMIIISIQSSFSDLGLPNLGISYTDKIIHFLVFGFLGLLIAKSMVASNVKHTLVLTILIGFSFAILDEWHQSFVPGREADILDLVADFLGIVFFATAMIGFLRKRKQKTVLFQNNH